MQRPLKIKYCGLRTADDIVVAAQCRVDYIGFILYPPSPRYIHPKNAAQSLEYAKRILHDTDSLQEYHMPLVVGVFVHSSIEQVIHAIQTVPLDVVQRYDISQPLLDMGVPYWNGVRLKDQRQLHELTLGQADAMVIDSFKQDEHGGTGTSFDWAWLRDTAMTYPYFIAGGITVHNVQDLLAYQPYGIDISSGIESSKGVKDHDLMYRMKEKIDAYYGTM